MAARRATNRDLAETGGMAIALANFSEPVLVVLARRGCARCDQVGATDDALVQIAGVERTRVERLDVGRRAAFTIFDGDPHRGKDAIALVIAPEQPRPRNAARIAGQVRPGVVVDVDALLPVTAAEERQPPAATERLAEERDRISSAERGSIDQQLAHRFVGWHA